MPLNHDLPAMQDYHKAKRLMWDPRDVDLATDQTDWPRLSGIERDSMLRMCSLFLSGEEAVTADLAPLLLALRAAGGPLEEVIFLTTQLFEEARHVEFFDRWLAEVVREPVDLALYQGPAYYSVFYDELPRALDRLLNDPSPTAQVDAVATYHLIVEGTLAETGYYVVSRAISDHGTLPGLVQGMQLIQRDEARHIAFGIALLQRLISADPPLWDTLNARMNVLLPLALDVVADGFAPYGDDVPFGLVPSDFIEYAATQFSHRVDAIARRIREA